MLSDALLALVATLAMSAVLWRFHGPKYAPQRRYTVLDIIEPRSRRSRRRLRRR